MRDEEDPDGYYARKHERNLIVLFANWCRRRLARLARLLR